MFVCVCVLRRQRDIKRQMHLIHTVLLKRHMLLPISPQDSCVNTSSLKQLYMNPEVTERVFVSYHESFQPHGVRKTLAKGSLSKYIRAFYFHVIQNLILSSFVYDAIKPTTWCQTVCFFTACCLSKH